MFGRDLPIESGAVPGRGAAPPRVSRAKGWTPRLSTGNEDASASAWPSALANWGCSSQPPGCAALRPAGMC